MLNQNNILAMNDENTCVCFMNHYAMNEYWELLDKIIGHMTEDLSTITGLKKEEILGDYLYKNDYDPIKEVLKKQGKWNADYDESLVMRIMKRTTKEN